ncbi:hypothetical protein Hypma_001813 [Hypsizygus marmoreus]|uniref:Septin-type G domain-containing protein n=1 Tax=Hypsizygus marmoreus TaxID=39966 RepID=A0A369JA93_HYPMA|nr:hypothetical protein Hypma_001813 [Hypsizygus marmoreus]
MEESISTSASTIRTFPQHLPDPLQTQLVSSVSAPSSPRSSALPSPPSSPSSDSVSSFPSVSSSFFFSSAAASPPHPQPQSDHTRDSTEGLIIPSLTLPSALRQPTPYGQTVGDVRLLVLGSKGAGKTFLSGLLLEENEDVVEVGTWEDWEYGRVIHASTDWIEHRDAHGLEKFEATRNIEIVELPGYDHNTNANELLQNLESIIHTPFYAVSDVLDPTHRPSPVVAGLVSSSSTPLYTALIFLLPSAPTVFDSVIIDTLGPQIPIVVLPRISNSDHFPFLSKLSTFRPPSAVALRSGIFHSPEIIATLRSEAADRFLRWREIERAVDDIHMSRRDDTLRHHRDPDGLPWNKAKWESEWVTTLSQDVAKRLRQATLTERDVRRSPFDGYESLGGPPRSCMHNSPYDPLHLPSLIMFSISLLEPLRARFSKSMNSFAEALGDWNIRMALGGGFCFGLSVGLLLKAVR